MVVFIFHPLRNLMRSILNTVGNPLLALYSFALNIEMMLLILKLDVVIIFNGKPCLMEPNCCFEFKAYIPTVCSAFIRIFIPWKYWTSN